MKFKIVNKEYDTANMPSSDLYHDRIDIVDPPDMDLGYYISPPGEKYVLLTGDGDYPNTFIYCVVNRQESSKARAVVTDEYVCPLPRCISNIVRRRAEIESTLKEIAKEKSSLKSENDLIKELKSVIDGEMQQNDVFIDLKSEIIGDISELIMVLEAGCYRSAIGMCGRILESVLKCYLTMKSISYSDDMMIGKLLTLIKESGKYLEPTLKNCINIINGHRIVSVHQKDKVPIPSRDNCFTVAYSLLDTIRRLS